jgi:hypothetical protein
MNSHKTLIIGGMTTIAVISLASPSFATTYSFTVSCQANRFVQEWDTGAIDPGKEYLRVATGTKNPNCSVSDYNPATDGGLPKNVASGVGGVIQGIPPVPIICGIFHCN